MAPDRIAIAYRLSRWDRVKALSFQLALAWLAVMNGATQLVRHETAPAVGRIFGIAAYTWSAGYAIAGALMIFGVLREGKQAEFVGCGLLATALAAQLAANLFSPPPSLDLWATILFVNSLATFLVATVLRMMLLLKGELRVQAVPVEHEP